MREDKLEAIRAKIEDQRYRNFTEDQRALRERHDRDAQEALRRVANGSAYLGHSYRNKL